MNANRVMKNFLDMVQIDSPSYHEAKMACFAQRYLEKLGFEVGFDQSQEGTGSDTPQIIAQRKASSGGHGHIALSAHMDCVCPCEGIVPRIEGDRVVSEGTTILSADDKSGIAQIFEGIEGAIERGVPLPHITVLLSVAEEQSVVGARYYPDPLFEEETLTLVLDSAGSPGVVITAAPYHYSFNAVFHGLAAHAGVEPEAGVNAIVLAARALCEMPLGRHDECTTSSAGIIEGGRAINIVPDEVILKGECRSLFKERTDALIEQMNVAMNGAVQGVENASVDIEWTLEYPGIYTEESDADIQMLLSCARSLGLDAHCETTGGGSDANILGAKGCKPVVLGTGMTNFHTLHEYITVADLENGARLIEEVLCKVGGGCKS